MKINQLHAPLNILLADDDMDDRIFFEKALKEIPLATTLSTVCNGEQLMDYLAVHEKQLPDVLFLDLSMPRKTGFECLAEIKENEKLKALTVIMFTTSFTRGFDLEDNLKATLNGMGASDYIRKPSDFNELKQIIEKTLNELIGNKKYFMPAKNLNILLADDDVDDCKLFKEALEALPKTTALTTVHDGDELMSYLTENTEQLPHVLFLDINMPRKNGFECLSEIKNNKELKDLPVVMYSTSGSKNEINILFNTGADVYIHKPSNFAQLVQVIHHALPIAVENFFSNGKIKYILNV